ncbi:MAG: hypothetical protein NC483_00570 [Ruminococcus sp.]|nr:hypothetical protein [Ruminococcus sp.]
MEKIINISGKNYQMKASALTQFSYKDFAGRSFLKDLQDLIKLKDKKNDSFSIDDLDEVSELLLKIAYILIKEADKEHNTNQAVDYEALLGSIDNLYDDEKWIYDVLELACTPISRQLQINKK